MRKLYAWLGAASLYMLVTARAEAANDVLKPYVVMILDTSNSMLTQTQSGPTSCGKPDNRLNHAVCAVNNIVNSYGDIVFALGRYRETFSSTSGTPGSQTCDANGDQDGNVLNTVAASGGDVCNTQGVSCADCNSTLGIQKACTSATQIADCQSDSCNLAPETNCGTNTVDDDNDGKVNDGCPAVGSPETGAQCLDAVDSDSDANGAVNDGCPVQGQCSTTFGCTNADRNFELLAGLVDGGNANAGKFVDGVCNSCDPNASGTNGEIWGIGDFTFGPLSASLLGAKKYWQGEQASDGTEIWGSAKAGFDPINRDPSNNVFLSGNSDAQCNPNPTSCVIYAESNCADNADSDLTGAGVVANDGYINDGCPIEDTDGEDPLTECDDAVDDDGDGIVNDGCPARCDGPSCCCTTQCRPYITIMLVDGDETCTSFDNTLASAESLRNTSPRNDRVNLSMLSRNGTVATATTAAAHPFSVGDEVLVVGVTGFTGTFEVLSTPTATSLTYDDNRATATATLSGSSFIGHTAFRNNYVIQVKPIGFGVAPGDPEIEALAHAGGAADIPNVNEGYYANDEADLQLAISQILADSVRGEVCNEKDDDCDQRIDEDFTQLGDACPRLCNGVPCVGLCADTGVFVCDGTGGVMCETDSTVTPQPEVCNNLDDNCNGLIDEGLTCNPCVPSTEICNGLNDDCDANVDEGLTRPCSIGTGVGQCTGVEACLPNNPGPGASYQGCTADSDPEICDGIDNDCDGQCDGIDLECSTIDGACDPSDPTSCAGTDNPGHPQHVPPPIPENACRPGTRTCAVPSVCGSANSFSSCSGEILPCGPDTPEGTPGCDGCDGVDNDCDNEIDENFIPSDCSTNCGVGNTQCMNGVITCDSTPAGTDTTCNNVDDDCDNNIDEEWVCPGFDGTSCPECGAPSICDGQPKCVNGAVVCQGPAAGVETCNCLDDDCDGTIDEDPTSGPICGGNGTCVPGSCQCAFGCVEGEFPCPVGKKCDRTERCDSASDNPGVPCTADGDCPNGTCGPAAFCVNDPCFDEVCNPVNGNVQTCIPNPQFPNEPQCVDVCSLINDADVSEFPPCPSGFVCLGSAGECRPNNCTTFPDMCTASQSCVGGECVSNPCQGVTCDTGKYCLGGNCVSSCADVTCAAGQRCRQGTCEADPCGEPCPFGQACNDTTGQCIEDPCKVRTCLDGQWCNPNSGQCEDDPCEISNITCPNDGELCRGGTCLDPDTLRPDAAGESHVTVGGGGGCSTTGGGSGLLLALGLLFVRRRRASRGTRTVGGAQ